MDVVFANTYIVLLLAAAASARQDVKFSSALKDQETAPGKVTSILIQAGPAGPRHIVLANGHEIYSSSSSGGLEETSSRAVNNYYYPAREEYQHTAAPPLRQATYGPARPVTLQGQLYHHRFAEDHTSRKIPHLKPVKTDIHKYSAFIKHDKSKEIYGYGKKAYNRDFANPDYTVSTPEREPYARRPNNEAFGDFQNSYVDDEEKLYMDSIGANYDGERTSDYSSEKRFKPYTKHQSYKHQQVNENKYYNPMKNYNSYSSYDDVNPDQPSGFDDHQGGQVVPLLARFYKQPLPIIQTQLPADNGGLFVQYVYPHQVQYDADQTNNYEQYPAEDRSSNRRISQESNSEWTPINAPSGAKPARSYDIPAPNLSTFKSSSETTPVFRRREPEEASVIVGKSKQAMPSNHHIQGNSEGVVSAVVRVKQ